MDGSPDGVEVGGGMDWVRLGVGMWFTLELELCREVGLSWAGEGLVGG